MTNLHRVSVSEVFDREDAHSVESFGDSGTDPPHFDYRQSRQDVLSGGLRHSIPDTYSPKGLDLLTGFGRKLRAGFCFCDPNTHRQTSESENFVPDLLAQRMQLL